MWWHQIKTHKLDETHDGQTLEVSPGELIEITLPHFSVDKWGFGWPCKFKGKILYRWNDTTQNNMQTLTFYARSTGTEVVDLERKQLPGYGNAVIKNYKVTIEVK